jgi:hypothetical protein
MAHTSPLTGGGTLAPFSPPARKGKGKRKPRPAPAKRQTSRLKVGMTVALGVGIPLLSLAMSKLAGTLAANAHYGLAGFALGLMVAVLAVSLSHLAWAVGDVTRSGPWASWAMAVSLDLSLVLCELCHVYAGTLGLDAVCYAVMVSVALASMALNVWAFLGHD